MTVGTRGSISVATWMYGTISALPSVAAISPPVRVWEDEAPGEIPFPVIVFQRVGPGTTVQPIGGPPVAYRYIYQWRVTDDGADSSTIEDIAMEIYEALAFTQVDLPDGGRMTITESAPEVIPVGPEGGDSTTEELGGEVEIMISLPVFG